jgi:hypothetical protein
MLSPCCWSGVHSRFSIEVEARKKELAGVVNDTQSAGPAQQTAGRFPKRGGEACASVALALAGAFGFAFSFLPGDSAIPPAQYR